jgi:putative addiction module component (TIGR02574 family)
VGGEVAGLHDIENLSMAERILYVQAVWDSIVAEEEQLPATDAQREELERRLEAQGAIKEPLPTWDEVKSKLKSGE